MDHSYSESDVSLSPSQILEKLEMLRQLQLLQRGKLLKQRLDYQNSSDISANITEIVSHFSNSTTYNTFRSLLQSADDISHEGTPRENIYSDHDVSSKNHDDNKNDYGKYPVVEGVSVLNISQESEFVPNSPVSSQSTTSNVSKNIRSNENNSNSKKQIIERKHISLDEMPILSPKKNFEELIVEKLKNEVPIVKAVKAPTPQKKQFLKRGEGMARFGVKKNDLKIQNTRSLPWRKNSKPVQPPQKPNPENIRKKPDGIKQRMNVQIIVPEKKSVKPPTPSKSSSESTGNIEKVYELKSCHANDVSIRNESSTQEMAGTLLSNKIDKGNIKNLNAKQKHPTFASKGKTWAAVLTKEQNDFLTQLKQCDYYKNFGSPAKSIDTDTSCCDSISTARNYKEMAEQNLFDLIENKVSHESFSIENSFFNRFIKNNYSECSGESTPQIMQKCLSANPNLMRLGPELPQRKRNINSYSEDETCLSECTDCSETSCSVSTCCSCKSTTQINQHQKFGNQKGSKTEPECQKKNQNKNDEVCFNDTLTKDKDIINANMAEMNAKLVATSELLKDRLHELEDEIETFRKENANISKMREEIDLERQKFYEEKAKFEQKFNEDKTLSEYYLAEEKEKLTKQKQMYERYVREMRGRLNKKEKDEVLNLKNEINNLKEEIRLKDAKSTSTIARLRNQMKLMEKDKKALEHEIEKIKKENKRLSHSYNVTRRLTNLKYLEQINKKLTNISSRASKSDVDLDPDAKYKTFEIEQQKNIRKPNQLRTRAKSVPNLNVTSKYAKYFSQKDSISDKNVTSAKINTSASEEDLCIELKDETDNESNEDLNGSDDEDNYLEKMYNERFKSISPPSKRSSGSSTIELSTCNSKNRDTSNFFIQKSNSVSSIKKSLSPQDSISSSTNHKSSLNSHQRSHNVSPQSNVANFVNNNHQQIDKHSKSQSRNKSPVSILSNPSSNSQKPPTVIYNESYDSRMMPSPEPIVSKTSLSKTSLNPTEIRKSDGSKELRFPNGNVKLISADGKYSKFIYYNGDIKENFYDEGRVKYFYSESKTFHTTYPHGLEVLEFPDGQVEKRYKDGSTEIRLPNGSIRYFDPKNDLVREDWRFPDGTSITVSASGEKRIIFPNGQIEVHAKDHKRREFPDGTVKLVYGDGTSETRYASGRVRIKDKHGNLLMDSASKTEQMHF